MQVLAKVQNETSFRNWRHPLLLVDAAIKDEDFTTFEFYVFNGHWDGVFNNGIVTVAGHDIAKGVYSILSKDQELLSGSTREVFSNFEKGRHV